MWKLSNDDVKAIVLQFKSYFFTSQTSFFSEKTPSSLLVCIFSWTFFWPPNHQNVLFWPISKQRSQTTVFLAHITTYRSYYLSFAFAHFLGHKISCHKVTRWDMLLTMFWYANITFRPLSEATLHLKTSTKLKRKLSHIKLVKHSRSIHDNSCPFHK